MLVLPKNAVRVIGDVCIEDSSACCVEARNCTHNTSFGMRSAHKVVQHTDIAHRKSKQLSICDTETCELMPPEAFNLLGAAAGLKWKPSYLIRQISLCLDPMSARQQSIPSHTNLKQQPQRKPTCSTKKCQQNLKAYLVVWEEQFSLLAAPPAAARVQQTVQGSRLGHQLMLQPLNQLASTHVFTTLHTRMYIRHRPKKAESSKHKLLLLLPGLLKQAHGYRLSMLNDNA